MTRVRAALPGPQKNALVVFSGEADLKWLNVLKPGFRHCFVILESDGRWILYDPLSHQTEITVIGGLSLQELMDGYRKHGFHVVAWVQRPARFKPAPLGLYTCVEAVKRVLGIHAPLIITPWNLFNFLIKLKK